MALQPRPFVCTDLFLPLRSGNLESSPTPRRAPVLLHTKLSEGKPSRVETTGTLPPAGHACQLRSPQAVIQAWALEAVLERQTGAVSGRRRQLCKPANGWVEKFLLSPPPCVRSCALRAPLLGSRLQSSPWALLAAAPPALLTTPDTPRRRPRAGCLPPPPSAAHAQLLPQGLLGGCSVAANLSTPHSLSLFPKLAKGDAFFKEKARDVKWPGKQLFWSRNTCFQNT